VGRLLPWFAVAYGAGIVIYFAAEREPSLWAAASLTTLCALAAVLLRRQIVPYVVALGAFGIALGFAVATFKTSLIDHPVLRFSTSGVTVAGFVELREESQHTDRFVLRVERMEGGRIDDKPRRVRLSVKRGTAPRDRSSRSKPRSSRRCNRSNQAATILPATYSSRASARPALSAAQ
jgi:competence protein ComEC